MMGQVLGKNSCSNCGKPINEDSEKRGGLCPECFKELVRVFNEKKVKNAIEFCRNHQPIIKKQENGKPFYACYLPTMMEAIEVESEKPNVKRIDFRIDFGQGGLQRIGNLVGMAGFYYDSEYYWASTPEKVFDAWNWFNQKTQANEDYWMAIESDTVRDFIDNNWRPFNYEFRDALTASILSLILNLYTLDSMNVDVSKKLSEIRQQMRGRIVKYERLSRSVSFSTNYKVSRKAMGRVTDLRLFLAHLSSESRLATFAKLNGFDVALSIMPDLIINGKRIDVKKPVERYVIPENRPNFITFVSDESTVIENLSNHVSEGFRQGVDVVAIEVNHLEKRPIKGFNSKWLGPTMALKNALMNAISYDKKGTVLLFRINSKGCFGRVLRCWKLQE
jgi:DNA-directed RNA polymerase subunit RPC12/RpoP